MLENLCNEMLGKISRNIREQSLISFYKRVENKEKEIKKMWKK